MALEKKATERTLKNGFPVRTSRAGRPVLVTIPQKHVAKLERMAEGDGLTLATFIRRNAVRAARRKTG